MRIFLIITSITLFVSCSGDQEGLRDGLESTENKESGDNSGEDTGGNTTPTSVLTYYNFARDVLNRECANCHGVPATDGAPNSFRLDSYGDLEGVPGSYSLRNRIKARVEDGTMPPPGTGNLTSEETTKLIEWVDAGAAEGTPEDPSQLMPKIIFSSPSTEGAIINESIDISVSFEHVASDATWSIYYSSLSNSTSGGTLIVGDLTASTTSYTWDTRTIAAGIYYVYVILRNGDNETKKAALGSITVSHPETGNNSPSILVTSPNGGEALLRGNPWTIRWSALDPDSGDSLTYTVEISPDSGTTWTEIASNVTLSSYNWTVPADQTLSQTYLVRVSANDGKGGLTSDQSNSTFEVGEAGIANPTYAEFDTIAQASCAGGGCHTNAGGGKGDYTGNQASVDANAASIKEEIVIGTMPKNGSLSASDKDTMINYLNSVIP